MQELDSALKPLLAAVLNYIQSAKAMILQVSHPDESPRIAGLHQGEI